MVRLYVGNLPFRAMEEDLHAFFSDAGFPLEQASVVRDRTSGESRGFGFVEIADRQVAEQAIEACNGREMGGRALVINEARPRTEGGGGGGYGRASGGADYGRGGDSGRGADYGRGGDSGRGGDYGRAGDSGRGGGYNRRGGDRDQRW
ncbi:MAG: RNA-binding protein [Bryobacterales bacterium]|jgi:RNA recognition motif-containing protein|nr:RNA-binding protein [Bryobacterales bacterium]